MKVTDNTTEIKRLDNKIREQSVKKEAELVNVQKKYDQRIEDLKIRGEDNYINTIKKNDDQLIDASKDYEEKLNFYKENLDKTQNNITKEENSLRNNQSNRIKNFKDQHQNSIQEQFRSANENQEAIHKEAQNSLQNITDATGAEINHLENTNRTKVNALSSDYNQKGISIDREYRATLDNDLRMHQNDINLQKTELKNVMNKTIEKNKRLETEKIKVQTAELDYLDNHQKNILSQKQNDFQVRYNNLAKEHESILAELKSKFEVDVKKMVEQNTVKKTTLASKDEDHFYRIETINPTITETQKDFTVSLKVPEHEKENVHLSIRGRGVKMTLTRQFADSIDEKDGSTNKSSRNELFSKEFPSKDILNSKLVAQKYEDGILTFKIQKL